MRLRKLNAYARRWIVLFCGVFILFLSISQSVKADMGPKPSVQIQFDGMGTEVYYVTLLSEKNSTGPWYTSTEPISETDYMIAEDVTLGMQAWSAFRSYHDSDGYYFIEYFEKCDETQSFEWGYYPPEKFKILIYFPVTDSFVTSGVLERYAFDSYYQVTYGQENNSLKIKRNYDYTWEMISLLARILATIGIELLIALLFRIRDRRAFGFIAVVNLITQTILNVLLNLSAYYSGNGFLLILRYIGLEVVITLLEFAAYQYYFDKRKRKSEGTFNLGIGGSAVYAITANAVSFLMGVFLLNVIPGIF